MSTKIISLKACTVPLIAFFLLFASNVHSQQFGQVVASKQKLISVYDTPGGKPVGKVTAEGLPWLILEEQDDFFLVTLNGRKVWVDSMDVRAARPSSDKCELVDATFLAGSMTAGSPGASARRCK